VFWTDEAAHGITNGIMKTAVSIPDDVFEKGEKAAKRLKMSRSELYAKAVEAYVEAHTPDAITESWNAMLSEIAPKEGEAELRVVRAAARQTMKRNPW
jgi:metal-responsive CopG/Arc/MetJ family transcriptional regulator